MDPAITKTTNQNGLGTVLTISIHQKVDVAVLYFFRVLRKKLKRNFEFYESLPHESFSMYTIQAFIDTRWYGIYLLLEHPV
jgi:hypothetical protein